MNRHIVVCLLALTAALAISACGETVIDNKKAEAAINNQLKSDGVATSSVTCPGDVKVEPGEKFECTVKVKSGATFTLPLRVKDKDGTVVPDGSLKKAAP